MKANELMVGDWVRLEGKAVRIRHIDTITDKVCYEGSNVLVGIEFLEPLPISGLEDVIRRPDMTCMWNDHMSIVTGFDFYELKIIRRGKVVVNVNVAYVHHVQHAMRVAGRSDDIELKDF